MSALLAIAAAFAGLTWALAFREARHADTAPLLEQLAHREVLILDLAAYAERVILAHAAEIGADR